MTRLLPTLRYVALTRAGTLHQAHDLIDYITGPEVVRMMHPLETTAVPGVIWGWVVWSQIEDRFAPTLSAAFEALAPGGSSEIEPTSALFHKRFEDATHTSLVAAYTVTHIRQGSWSQIVDRDVWLAQMGLQLMVEPTDIELASSQSEAILAARNAEPASTLTVQSMRAMMQSRYDELITASGLTPLQLRMLHGQAQALAENLSGTVS